MFHAVLSAPVDSFSQEMLYNALDVPAAANLLLALVVAVYFDTLQYDIEQCKQWWHPVARSLLTFIWADQGPSATAKNTLRSSNELAGLSKALQLNTLQIAALCHGVHCSLVVGDKAPSRDRVAK